MLTSLFYVTGEFHGFLHRGRAQIPEKKSGVTVLVSLVGGKSLKFCTCTRICRTLMTRKSCAVGMRNAILENYLKVNFKLIYREFGQRPARSR